MPRAEPLTVEYLERTLKIDFGAELLELLNTERINTQNIFRLLGPHDPFFQKLPAAARLAIIEYRRASRSKRKRVRLDTPAKMFDVPPPPPLPSDACP